jgi:hypothetical protein
MITGIIKTLTSREAVVWEGELSAPDFDFRLILAASIVLHSDMEEL